MKLSDLANKLLDLGKRNRLLNYKETGFKSITILNKNYKEIFDNLTSSKEYTFMLLDPLLERFHKTFSEDPNDIVAEYSPLKVYDICKEAVKPKELIAYKKGYKLDRTLKSLMKEYKYSISEKGINSLYLTFGFVYYYEDKTKYKAPLLLIPVEYEKNTNGVYKISTSDDDIILNPTLDYFFNTTRHFDIPNYDGIDFDFDVYMEEIKKVLPEDVVFEEGMSLGIYSFLKMNMYRDLKDHQEKVIENRNIRALLGNQMDGELVLDGEVLPVVNCDSSQKKAIEIAVSGKSFCLQGPPGSGKSQTITNIIASLIGNGRHVLFVSEKLQALQVVYENLKRAGLSEFAIELHSSKANKKTFIDNLYKTATLPKYSIANTAEATKEDHAIISAEINRYRDALNKKVENEAITVFELFSLYMAEDGTPLEYKFKDIEKNSISSMNQIGRVLREYKDSISPIGYDYRNTAFYGFNDMNKAYVSYEMNQEFSDAISYLNRLGKYQEKINSYVAINGRDVLSIDDLYLVFDFIPVFNQIKNVNLFTLSKENVEKVLPLMEEYLSIPTTSSVVSNYDKDILNIDIAKLLRTLKSYTGMFKSFHKEYRVAKKEVISYRAEKTSDKKLIIELKELIEVKNNLLRRKKLKEDILSIIPYATSENMQDLYKDAKIAKPYVGILVRSEVADSTTIKNTLLDQMLSFKNYQDGDINLRKLAVRFDPEVLNFYKQPLSVVLSHLTEMFKLKDKMPSYMRVLNTLNDLKKEDLLDFLHAYLDLGLGLENMDSSFRKTFLQNKVFYTIQNDPYLRAFSTNMFKEKVNEFVNLDEALMRLNRDYIISVNSLKRPDDVLLEGSQFKVLAKEANKIRRQKPIRMLLSEIFDFAMTIKPVFLMSPLSVSTYLTEENEFDCVIFDEASQIFAEDAFGAIYRGKQCIIIGDSKQMPPSNFFSASIEDSDEEDYDSIQESILDMGATYLPTTSLKWHYRSRSEELISFSNKEFYDSTLITIPEAKRHEKGFGIDFIYVKDGIYNAKNRTNPKEAELISDMVIEHYKSSTKSLGVVAFSKVQADLIEDMVEDKIKKYPELHKYFTDEEEEPFFVKNLETVQGDERDRIIFSICYGYNSDGKFYQRFGPLNNLGGERRLNVAVTRSKYNITVVSSIRSNDIRETNTESIGVKLLKNYLEFAENVEAKKNYSETDNGIILSVKEFLEDNNCICYTNYGSSSFRVPLAVKEHEEDNFFLAVMIDGVSRSENITDTNRLEQLLLERQGWKYYKIYSTGWIQDPKSEGERLLDFIRNSTVEDIKVSDEAESYIVEADNSLESHFENYNPMKNEILMKNYMNKGLEYAMAEFLKQEEPVNKDYYLKKCAIAMGKTKVTNVVKNEAAKSMPINATTIGDTIWLNPKDNVGLRINSERMLNEIPLEELKEGIYTIVSYSDGITVEGAFKAMLKLLGFTRLTDNTKKLLMNAVVFLKLEGRIIQKGECLYI